MTNDHASDDRRGETDRLDENCRQSQERIHRVLIDDARRGLADIAAGRTHVAETAIAMLQRQRRAGTASTFAPSTAPIASDRRPA